MSRTSARAFAAARDLSLLRAEVDLERGRDDDRLPGVGIASTCGWPPDGAEIMLATSVSVGRVEAGHVVVGPRVGAQPLDRELAELALAEDDLGDVVPRSS